MQNVTKVVTVVLALLAVGLWLNVFRNNFPWFGATEHDIRPAVWISVFAAVGWVLLHVRDMRGEDETRCRKCRHILRGITEPRCPECGERI